MSRKGDWEDSRGEQWVWCPEKAASRKSLEEKRLTNWQMLLVGHMRQDWELTMRSGDMVTGDLAKSYLDDQVSTSELGRKGSRDFKTRQAFGRVLCKKEPRKLMMQEWLSLVDEQGCDPGNKRGFITKGNSSAVVRVCETSSNQGVQTIPASLEMFSSTHQELWKISMPFDPLVPLWTSSGNDSKYRSSLHRSS